MNHSEDEATQLLRAWRRGDPAAQEALIEWCGAFVTRNQSQGMGQDDRDSIVNEAWSEFLELIDNQLYQELRRALWRTKKRWQRERVRSSKQEPDDEPAPGPADPGSLVMNRQLLRVVLKTIFAAFESELPQLSQRDHDILTRFYELEAFFPPKAPPVPFRTADAARRAQSRARRRLAEASHGWLARRLEDRSEDRHVVELAQEVVRGDRFLNVVDLLAEFEREA